MESCDISFLEEVVVTARTLKAENLVIGGVDQNPVRLNVTVTPASPRSSQGMISIPGGQRLADKQKLDTLINKGVPMPSPAAPAVVPTPRKT